MRDDELLFLVIDVGQDLPTCVAAIRIVRPGLGKPIGVLWRMVTRMALAGGNIPDDPLHGGLVRGILGRESID